MQTVNFCLPGACLTAFVKEGDATEDVAAALARRYETHTGIALEPGVLEHIENKINKETGRA